MNLQTELKHVYEKLENAGYPDVRAEIFDAQLSGSTGGEIFLMVTQKLKFIKSARPEIYFIIKSEIDTILSYGKEMGYLSEE